EALTGARISVGAPYFNLTFAPLVVPLFVALPFGPFLAWKRGDIVAAAERLLAALAVAIGSMLLVGLLAGFSELGAVAGIGLAVWVMAGAISELAFRIGVGRAEWLALPRRAAGLPRAA